MKRTAGYAIVVLATLALLLVLWKLHSMVILFLLSIAIAAAFRPLISFFVDHKMPRGFALIFSYLLVFAILGGLIFLINRPLMDDLQDATNHLMITYDNIKTNWPSGTGLQKAISDALPTVKELTDRLTGGGQEGPPIMNFIGLTSSLLDLITNTAMMIILSIYWSADYLRFERIWMSLVPVEARAQARETYRAIETGLGAYVRSELIQSVLAGIMLWVGFRLIGIDYPMLLALIGAIAWLIPWFGALVAIIPPLIVGLGTGGIPLAALAVGYTLLVLVIQEFVIEPRFFTHEVYSSVILVVIVLILANEFGLVGLILAPLVSAAVQITLRYLAQPPIVANLARIPVSEFKEEIGKLQDRVDGIEKSLADEGEQPTPDLLNLISRLKELISEAQSYLGKHPEEVEAQKPPDPREKLPLPGTINTNRS